MIAIAAAEWLKLRSVRSTLWFTAGAFVVMLLVGGLEAHDAAAAARADGEPAGSIGPTAAVVTAAGWVQFIALSVGMLAMTSEYATRSIEVTLACSPSRTRLLAAKATVVGGAVLGSGLVLAALGTAVARLLLGEYGDIDFGTAAARILQIGVYCALIAVLALGLGTLVRRSAGTLTVLFLLLLIFPSVLQQLAETLDADVLNTIADYTPMPAGQRLMEGEWAYALILAAWSVTAVLAGARTLQLRDV